MLSVSSTLISPIRLAVVVALALSLAGFVSAPPKVAVAPSDAGPLAAATAVTVITALASAGSEAKLQLAALALCVQVKTVELAALMVALVAGSATCTAPAFGPALRTDTVYVYGTPGATGSALSTTCTLTSPTSRKV